MSLTDIYTTTRFKHLVLNHKFDLFISNFKKLEMRCLSVINFYFSQKEKKTKVAKETLYK